MKTALGLFAGELPNVLETRAMAPTPLKLQGLLSRTRSYGNLTRLGSFRDLMSFG